MKRIKKFEQFGFFGSQKPLYPTMEEVEEADRFTICKWYRFLDSPGMSAIGKDNFEEVMQKEGPIMDRIHQRFRELGGFTPEISKALS